MNERTLLGFNKPDLDGTSKKTSSPGVLFDGSRMLSFKIFDKEESLFNVTVAAHAPDGPLTVSIPIDSNCYLTSGKLVHQMAARRQIQDLEENSSYLSDEITEEISDIALKHSIASKYTSFVGVDKKTRKSVLEPSMSSRQIHQEVPLGYGSYDSFKPQRYRHARCAMASTQRSMPLSYECGSVNMVERSSDRLVSYKILKKFKISKGFPGASMFASMASMVTSTFGASATTSPPSDNPTEDAVCSMSPDMTKSSGVTREVMDYACSEDSDSSSDSDDGWSSNPRTRSSGATPASTDGKSTSLPQKETSKNESLTNLIHFQLANGSFKFGQALENLIGMSEQELMEKCYKGEDSTTWITAVAFATLEKFFPNDKDLWDLVANKAKLFIQKHAKNNFDDMIKNAKTLI